MNLLFSPVHLSGQSYSWGYRTREDSKFPGYYHWHSCCEALFVHEGQGRVILNQRTYEIRPGMLYFFQPYQLHKVYAEVSPETPYVRSILHLDSAVLLGELHAFPKRQKLLRDLLQGQAVQQVFDLAERLPYVEQTMAQFAQNGGVTRGGRAAPQEEVNLFVLTLLGLLQPADHTQSQSRHPRYSDTIMQWIEAHYAEEVTLERVAEDLHLSKFYVSRIFRQETGSSLTDYVTARRIKQACRLLQTTLLPVDRIGADIGMPNVSYFIHVFKKVVGTTPLQYRRRS